MALLDNEDLDKCLNTGTYISETRLFFEEGIEKIYQDYRDNPTLIESSIHDALQLLDAADNASETYKKRNAFKKFVGIFSGGNNKLRDFSADHLREAQRAVFKLIEKLAENDMILMDAIKLNQRAIEYLQFQSICLKKLLVDTFQKILIRFEKVETAILNHKYRINLLEFNQELAYWLKDLREPGMLKAPSKSVKRIFEIASSLMQRVEEFIGKMGSDDPVNIYRWNSRIITDFRTALRDFTGFSISHGGHTTDYEVSFDELIQIIYEEISEMESDNVFIELHLNLPIGFFIGATSSAKIIYFVNEGINNQKSLEEIKQLLTEELNHNLSTKISWITFGQEILWQMKLLSDQTYIELSLKYMLKQLRLDFLDNSSSEISSRLISEHRIKETPSKSDYPTLEFLELVRGKTSINFSYQIIIENDRNAYINLITEFKNPSNYIMNESILQYAEKNKMNIIENYTLSGDEYFEVGYKIKPDWLNWNQEKNLIAKNMTKTINDLNIFLGD